MFKKLLAGVITAVLSLGVVVLVAAPASAHHNTIWPEVTCAVDGSYDISWSVENSETNKTEVITESNKPEIVPANTFLAFHEKKFFPQNVSTPQSITLSLTGFWDGDTSTTGDDVYNTTSYTLTADRFPKGCLKVTGDATPKPSVCTGPNTYSTPSYTLKNVPGIKYTVNGTPTAAGTDIPTTNGTSLHIEASASDPTYEIIGTKVWDFTFTAPDATCTVTVDPVTPDFKKQVCTLPGQHSLAQYFIPNTTGVIYSVKIANVETVKGTGWYDVPDNVTALQIIARGDTANYYVLRGDIKIYDFTVDLAGPCLVEVTPVTPTVSSGLCDVENAPGQVPPTTYTLKGVDHVIYIVTVNGGAPTEVTVANGASQTFPLPAGAHLVVTAKADDATKYQTKAFSFDKQFTDPGDCKGIVTPLAPDPAAQFCDDSDPDHPILVDGAIILKPAANITYYVDGAIVTDPTQPFPVDPGDHTITATFDQTKYKLADGAKTTFTLTVAPGECLPTEPLVTPAVVSSQIGCFSSGSYTLKNDLNDSEAVIWTVNSSTVSPGKYSVQNSSTVRITAAPNAPRYGFQDGTQTSWTITFTKPTVCDLETLALTGQSPTGLLIAADLLVVAGLAMFAMRAVRRGRPQQA